MISQGVSIVVPTYREAENIPLLTEAIEKVMLPSGMAFELLFMDDSSNDGTEAAVANLNRPWVRLVVRKGTRGLSAAVLEGFGLVKYDTIVVMDADLSHPPDAILDLLKALHNGAEVAVGSRYINGSAIAKGFNILRKANSYVATALARPLVSLKDPMSGFFAFRKKLLDRAPYFNPVGYKILLEVIVKTSAERVIEVPIHFGDRIHGKSKLTLTQQLLYLQHLRRLYLYKFAERSCMAQFALVGLIGVMVNLSVLTVLDGFEVAPMWSLACGIGVSMVTNFVLNRRLTFSYARDRSIFRQFVGFIGVCFLGGLVNYGVAMAVANAVPVCHEFPQLAALIGIAVGTGINYLANRFVVFRRKTT